MSRCRELNNTNILVGGARRVGQESTMPKIDEIDRRTDVVFLLFYYAESIRGVTKVQKLLFLIEQETEFFQSYRDNIDFEFSPYKMGPFSQHVYQELQFLLQLDAIETKDLDRTSPELVHDSELVNKEFTITEKGMKIAIELNSLLEEEYRQELQRLVEDYSDLQLSELLRHIYTEYPAYAEESEIKPEVLEN